MADENVLQYTTREGQRWDQIGQDFYGAQTVEVDGVQRSTAGFLIEANPGVPVYDAFPAGVVLDIPIIDKSQIITDKEKLPPWKQ
jgi:hypothetical protein